MLDLTQLGLTKNETKVFRTLIKLGKAGSSVISKESGVSYSRIYDVLASLEHKGLIRIIPEKGKKFIPSDPEILKNLIKEKKTSLEVLDKEIDKLKKIYNIKEKDPIQIASGKRNFYKLEKELQKPKRYEYNIKYSVEYQPIWAREQKTYIKKGIELKELVRVDKETKENIIRWLKIHKNVREIPNEGIAISIRDDKEVLIALIKSNTMLLIKDSSFVKLMKELYNGYYQQAKIIEQ